MQRLEQGTSSRRFYTRLKRGPFFTIASPILPVQDGGPHPVARIG